MSGRSTLVVINSAQRNADSQSSSNFTYNIGQSVDANSIAIKSISIPVTQYNIEYPNNGLVYYVSDNPFIITIPPGQYTTNQIIAIIVPLFLSQAGITMVVTQNAYTNKLSFNSVIPFQFVQGNDTIYRLLTVLGEPSVDTGVVSTLNCSNIPNLSGLKNFYVLSKVLSSGGFGLFNSGVREALQTNVPITVPYGSVQNYEPAIFENNIITFASPVNIQFIDIKIVDSNLNIVDLNGADIELIYKIFL
jgi:hypothetical protein